MHTIKEMPQVTGKDFNFESSPTDSTINGVLVDLKLGKWHEGALLKKWWFWVVLIVMGIFVSEIFLFPPPPLSQQKFARIREGMTKAEVVDIMGSKESQSGTLKRRFDPETERTDFLQWFMDDGGSIDVYFHKDGTVHHASYWTPSARSVPEKLHAWWKWLGS